MAFVDLFTKTFNLAVVIVYTSLFSVTLKAGYCHLLLTTREGLLEKLLKMVYFTSMMSSLQTITCIRPLSKVKTTLPGFIFCETMEAFARTGVNKQKASSAITLTFRAKGIVIFNMRIYFI